MKYPLYRCIVIASSGVYSCRFYQNVREVVHERDEPGRNSRIAYFIQPFTQLEQFIVDSQELLEGIVVDHHVGAVYVTFSGRPSRLPPTYRTRRCTDRFFMPLAGEFSSIRCMSNTDTYFHKRLDHRTTETGFL
jgi:hypothetical protein